MKTNKIKTIDIQTLTWFDKINGNTYFAQRITLNYGLQNETEITNPFQYGYSSYRFRAFECLRKNGYFKDETSLCNVIVRESERKALKRELINI